LAPEVNDGQGEDWNDEGQNDRERCCHDFGIPGDDVILSFCHFDFFVADAPAK
jgi:hypothetical protein